MKREDARTGMVIKFGRPGGEKTLGKITKLNPKNAKVESMEGRGSGRGAQVGATWNVPYSLMQPADSKEVTSTEEEEIVCGKTTFHAVYADSNPEWTVLRKVGHDVYLCEVTNSPDYEGTQKVFLKGEILAAIAWSNTLKGLNTSHRDFYSSLKPGQTVHYHNGFNSWVRCEVVQENGANVLRPVALLGKWNNFDLPSYNRKGEIHYPYYPQMIVNGDTFRPNSSNTYEGNPRFKQEVREDPLLPEVSLIPPPMTEEQSAQVPYWIKLDMIQHILSEGTDNPQESLKEIQSILDKS